MRFKLIFVPPEGNDIKLSIPNLGATQFASKYSTEAVRDFLQPRGTLDSLYIWD